MGQLCITELLKATERNMCLDLVISDLLGVVNSRCLFATCQQSK